MRKAKPIAVLALVLIVGTSLRYGLPRQTVVRIVGVKERLETLGWNRVFYSTAPSGQTEGDVRMIETIRPYGSERVFLNEDTGWIWPPHFKFNSTDMQARGRDLLSTSEEPVWVVVSFYGMRSAFLSIFPNVLKIGAAGGPEVRVIQWARIIFLIVVAAAAWLWITVRRRRNVVGDLAEVGSCPRDGPPA